MMEANPVTLRRSRSLVLNFEGSYLFGVSLLTKQTMVLDHLDTSILSYAHNWMHPAEIFSWLEGVYGRHRIATQVLRLMDAGFMVVYGTPPAEKDSDFESQFAWGLSAGYYHFSIKDPSYMSPEETSMWLLGQVTITPPVSLYTTNDEYKDVVQLPPPQVDEGIMLVMRQRRSYRGFDSSKPISLEHLRDCLFAGFGIIGFVETPIPGEGLLPLKMTPSGGARNPYEAYVYAPNVTGLRGGIYHYSAVDNSLGFVTESDIPDIGTILAGQPWFNNAAALIFLVANFERVMWKYPHPTGYRVAILEAGHIAQNIMLAATNNGLASAPTCAISDSIAEGLLGLNSVTKSVVYTVSIGIRSDIPSQADVTNLIPNPKL